jgi:uncharacterized delta-60 repeat protein
VTGSSYSGTSSHAARFTNGVVEDLGTIPGGITSSGWGINDLGQVAGDSEYSINGGSIRHAALFANGAVTDLGALPLWGNYARGNGVNNAGEVVGHSGPNLSTTVTHAFIWDSINGMRDIDPAGGYAKAFSINNSHVVTGTTTGSGSGAFRAFIWDASNGVRDIGTIAGSTSSGAFINDNGHVTGTSTINTFDNRQHAFLYDGTMHDLGALGDNDFFSDRSTGNGLNIHDQVVGSTYRPYQGGGNYQIPFIYTGGQMYDLETLVDASGADYRLYTATGINDAGQIAVSAIQRSTGQIRAVLLTPNIAGTPLPTATASASSTNTPTPTPTGAPLAAISGTVTYGNAVGAPTLRSVSNVLISGAGSTSVSTLTGFPGGAYSLGGFGAGSYTVTPAKANGANGISSFDAARIAQHASGINLLNGSQLIVADVSENGTVSSFDAGQVARYAVSIPGSGGTGTWVFSPVSRSYPSVTTNIMGQDYSALLMGEVSGNWTDNGLRPFKSGGSVRSASVALPRLLILANDQVIIPVSIRGVVNTGIISYEFQLRYDPSVVRPLADPVDLVRTVSGRLSAVANAEEPGLLRVAVYGPVPLNRNGVLINLRFTAVGAPGSVSPLTWERIMFNEGDPQATATDGQVALSATAPNEAEFGGPILTTNGQSIPSTGVPLTDSKSQAPSIISTGFGPYTAGAAFGAPGDLDSSFGTGGQVVTMFSSSAGGTRLGTPEAVIVQPDGKIIAAGMARNLLNGGQAIGLALVRYNVDGSLDEGFDGDGKVHIRLNGFDTIHALAVSPDGKIVATGLTNLSGGGNNDFAFLVTRFNPNGSLDTSFNGSGYRIDNWTSGLDEAVACAVQPDGKIIAGGFLDAGTAATDFAMARYNLDGSLDTGFGSGGLVRTDFDGTLDGAQTVVLMPDGKIILGGAIWNAEVSNGDFGLIGYNSDGTVDTAFGTGGKVRTDFDGESQNTFDLELTTGNKLLLTGCVGQPGLWNIAAIRYNADGSLDSTFDGDGKFRHDFLAGAIEGGVAVKTQTNGKIVIAADVEPRGTEFDFAVMRLNADGTIDTGFGNNGITFVDFGRFRPGPLVGFSNDDPTDMWIAPDGKIVVAGDVELEPNMTHDFGVARFLGDPVSSAIAGTIIYGNAVGAPTLRSVSNVLISGSGATSVTTLTAFPGGEYSLSGFGAGSYTVTPTKTGGANNITSFDAARIAQHAAGINFLTGNQLIVADVSENGAVSSFDAGQVARYAVSVPGSGGTGNWIFGPASRSYPSVTANITDQNYSALLMGEVSGNWTNTGARPSKSGESKRGMTVNLPRLVSPTNAEITIPVTIRGVVVNKGIISYEFDLRYDPSVIQPQADPVGLAGTASRGFSFASNAEEAGLLRVAVFGTMPLDGDGLLLNLKFTAVGAPGTVSPLTWERLMLNEGDPQAIAAAGQVRLSAAAADSAEMSGRLLNSMGQGIPNANVTLTDTAGKSRSIISNGFGYYRLGGLKVAQTYTIKVESRGWTFPPLTISVTGGLISVDMIADH